MIFLLFFFKIQIFFYKKGMGSDYWSGSDNDWHGYGKGKGGWGN